MSRAAVFRLLFILYCVEVGTLLVMLPYEGAEASLWDDLWKTRDQQAIAGR